ncbi:hypothetical protein SNEBB_011251 [Seison nebaliae]|nr:hypothetical protein SNEBB_011251 [Seison nebaliae]
MFLSFSFVLFLLHFTSALPSLFGCNPSYCKENEEMIKGNSSIIAKPNGCGTDNMNVNWVFGKFPKIINCCNDHDNCFSECDDSATLNHCNNKFNKCILQHCAFTYNNALACHIARSFVERYTENHISCSPYIAAKKDNTCICVPKNKIKTTTPDSANFFKFLQVNIGRILDLN